jgi:hypothetical protein
VAGFAAATTKFAFQRPAELASPAASRTCQLALTGSTLVGMRTMNERACMFTSVFSSAPGTGLPEATSSSCACCAETTSAYWMPDERSFAFAGHASPAVGAADPVERPLGNWHVGVRQRVPVDAPVRGLWRVAHRGGEDVRTVFVGWPLGVHEATVDLGERTPRARRLLP